MIRLLLDKAKLQEKIKRMLMNQIKIKKKKVKTKK
jgi:hypothetical protein